MLKPLYFTPFTTDEIKPAGWLKKQLEIQAEGLSGNLDKIWPDIKDSRWIGGDREGWKCSIVAASKEMSFNLGICSVNSKEVVASFLS